MKVIKDTKQRYASRCAALTDTGRCIVHAPLEVHHIDGNKGNNSPINLVPLCRKHHRFLPTEYAQPELLLR